MPKAKPFRIEVPDAKIEAIRERVENYTWFPAPANEQGFAYGMSTPVMKDLQRYWLSGYDWRTAETDLNRYPSYKADVDGLEIHFIHVVGEAGGSRPLLLTHGWPGSFYEFWEAVGPLAFPSKHGGKAEDAFDLVIPSLPGYGFSEKPASPLGQRATAKLWNTLMQDVLGYETYLAQGGDWGGLVTSWIGLDHGTVDGKGGCKAIHLNMIGFRPSAATPPNKEEVNWLTERQAAMQTGGAYFMEQATKPQTLAMALMDSPMGTAAWIIEKFHGWSDLKDGDLFSVYSKDQLLTNVMIYLVNDAIATSVWYYNAFLQEGGLELPEGVRCETPTAFANFPGEEIYAAPPRTWCDRAYNITRWTDMPRGGHFAAMEAPDLFVEDVRAWAREAG
ncbi:epoxide hydrolase family protein [Hyphomonas johnsonii]|uniref:Epoxide hydrolase n=1 Tax=Hyphomonas johnsonii MHS-2 TaxID=1280950 RepID=A0A059FVI8_9PROT|nr:epoxide hydrolase family protein [Hyphomonas johnsonii]KCZ94607.1 epoxide hydrolase [Hyphomonas johnsonii MHS-2]